MSTDRELPPAESETTSKNSSSLSKNPTQTTSTNKPETDHTTILKQDSDPCVKENESTSKNSTCPKDDLSPNTIINSQKREDTGNLKQGSANEADPHVQEITPGENETSKNSSPPKNNITQATATGKQEPDDTEALTNDADPHVQEITSVEDETTSKISSPPNNNPTQVRSTNKQETDDTKTIKQDSDPSVKEIPPAENETTSLNTLPPKDNLPQTTSNQKTEDTENLKQGSAPGVDPHAQEITPLENPPTNNTPQTLSTSKQETDYTEAVEKESANVANPHGQDITPIESETTSKSPHPPTQITATNKPETDEIEALKQESANVSDSHPPVKEFSPFENSNTSKSSSPSRIDSSNDANAPAKKNSCWKKLNNIFPKRGGGSQPKTKVEISARSSDEKELLSNLIAADVNYINSGAYQLDQYNEQLNLLRVDALEEFKGLKKDGNEKDFRELRKAMIKLKLQIPSKYNVDADTLKNLQQRSKARQNISKELLNKMPHLHKNGIFESSTEFKDFEARYNELGSIELKLCLLCFSVFPENAIIKKRLLVQWWVAEGFASEEVASKIFLTLMKKGFIEPVNENRSPFVGCYRMYPFYRSALTTLAERSKFFNFDANGLPTQNFTGSFQACLVGEGLISYEDLKNKLVTVDDLEKIHLLINVNEPILDFKPDWFSKMRNVNVLYLGRWKVLATDHIEVEDTTFLNGFENMNYLRFLSLQGVSNIITLPKSILMLKNLEIWDLRACHNLEAIPEGIGLLKRLTHLDMSECYLLDHMPKSLSFLKDLRVLKGFVVVEEQGKACTLVDLNSLPKLTKLCISTGLKEFPNDSDVSALGKLTALRKLTIEWGRDTSQAGTKEKSKSPDAGGEAGPKLPLKLEKLDLKCFPKRTTPSWLALKNLKDLSLKKLYIRGGKFSDLGQYQDIDDWNLSPGKKDTWKVEVLRLKYLTKIEMNWRQLQELFPDLMYLEQVRCPKLTLFPCHANGVWINQTKWKTFQETQFPEP